MTDFETRLKEDLARAAELAPTFRGVQSSTAASSSESVRRGHAPRWRLAAIAAAAAVAVGATAPWWLLEDEGGSDGQASCAAILEVGTTRYVGHGELLRVPRPGRSLGSGTMLGCGDVEDRSTMASTLPGVDPATAVFAEGSVWLADGQPAVPAELRVLSEPVACTQSGAQSLVGDWVSVDGAMPESDGALRPPYVVMLQADTNDALPFKEWSSVRVEIRVNDQISGASDPDIVTQALQGDTPVRIDVTCIDGEFIASRIILERGQ
ncbi:hypothetical protein [Nocardioides sp. WS12]|uniref:hypothetical protein n=1 Tax=Nocardioides sp. WS12 TaxID=2486272 RepID=UPI0015F8FF27|nr:hypothetical protein [Nocardioides sp. WS12]